MWKCPVCGRTFTKQNQSHYCQDVSSIDQYIDAQAEEARPLLQQIRETIQTAAPEAIEKISYSMPTFWQGRNLIQFAAFKQHIGVFPGDLSRLPFTNRLAELPTSKGTIRFTLDKPIDFELIADITRYKVAMLADDASDLGKAR